MKIEKDKPVEKQISISTQDMGDRTIRFCISNEEQDRDGDIVKADGCDFTNFAKNPQFLGFHNSRDFPLGVPKKWWVDRNTKSVWSDVYFPTIEELATDPAQASEKAKLVDFTYHCYKTGMLSAVSVSFLPKELEPNPASRFGSIISKWELYEFSAVPVPANADALAMAAKAFGIGENYTKMFGSDDKGAVPFKHYALAGDDVKWDARAVVKASEIDDLKVICTWYADKPVEDLTKGDFKLPHHMSKADGYKTVWAGVAAAMAALLGSRGGVDIPDSDRKAVYNHLVKHYREFDKDPPEFKSFDPDQKSGKRISAETMKTLESVKACHEKMKACSEKMKACLKEYKACHEEMEGVLTGLMTEPGEDGGEDEPDNGEKMLKIADGNETVLDLSD